LVLATATAALAKSADSCQKEADRTKEQSLLSCATTQQRTQTQVCDAIK
jgi:hypothetical protein